MANEKYIHLLSWTSLAEKSAPSTFEANAGQRATSIALCTRTLNFSYAHQNKKEKKEKKKTWEKKRRIENRIESE